MAATMGKPGTNWKQVDPASRKKIGPIVRHYMKKAHPFRSCVLDNTKRFGKERAERICAVVKDMGQRRTTWRKGGKGKVTEAPAELEADFLEEMTGPVFDEHFAPALDAAGLTPDELAAWADDVVEDERVMEALAGVEFDDPNRIVEAAAKVPMSHTKRRSGESLGDWGKRLKAGDRRKAKRAEGEKDPAFEKEHPRGRGGLWIVKAGDTGELADAVKKRMGKGKLTDQKIRDFQKRNGLVVDGKVGQQTAAALLGNKNASKVKTGSMSRGQRQRLRGKRVRETPEIPEGFGSDVTFKPSELVEAARGAGT